MLVQLEAPDILGHCGIGRAAEKCRKAPNMANVVLSSMRPQASHQHVLLHALAER
jgi:hypothetical protein